MVETILVLCIISILLNLGIFLGIIPSGILRKRRK